MRCWRRLWWKPGTTLLNAFSYQTPSRTSSRRRVTRVPPRDSNLMLRPLIRPAVIDGWRLNGGKILLDSHRLMMAAVRFFAPMAGPIASFKLSWDD
jgi:hypothetical protein